MDEPINRRTALKSTGAAIAGGLGVPTLSGPVAAANEIELFANLRFLVYEDEDGGFLRFGTTDEPTMVAAETTTNMSSGWFDPDWIPPWASEENNGGYLHKIPAVVEMQTDHPNDSSNVSFSIDADLYGNRKLHAIYDPDDQINSGSDFFRPGAGATFDASDLDDADGRVKPIFLIIEGQESSHFPFPSGSPIGQIEFSVRFWDDSIWRNYGYEHTVRQEWKLAQHSKIDVEDDLLEPTRKILRDIPAQVVGLRVGAARTALRMSNSLRSTSVNQRVLSWFSKSDGHVEKAVDTLVDTDGKEEGRILFAAEEGQRLVGGQVGSAEQIGDVGTGGPSLHFTR